MIKTIGFAAALSALLLSGCGGGGSTNNTPSAIETAQNKLLGNWELTDNNITGCYNDPFDGTSENIELSFTKDNALYIGKDYSELNCQESDLSYHGTYTFDYTIGKQTKGSKDEIAYEIDVTQTGFTLHTGEYDGDELEDIGKTEYTMFTFKGEKLELSYDNDEVMDGTTKEKRSNEFDSDEYWTKK